MEKKFYRNTDNRIIAGVCSGLAEYLSIDVTVVRLLCVLFALMGYGCILYLVAALITPEKP